LEQQVNLPRLAATFFELARLYHRTGCLERARLYFKDALRLFRRVSDEDKVADTLAALGNLEMQTGRLAQAQNHLQEAQQYYQSEGKISKMKEANKLLKLVQEMTAVS
jgi:tetratricopeptide (TPR) repeat protein